VVPVLVLLGLAATGAAPDYTVVLDAGHGGSNLGAAGVKGVLEKNLTLDLVRRIERKLAARGKVKVVSCRTSDVLVPIRTRVRCANDAQARLFLSVHANASPMGPRRGSQRGFELYVLPVEDVDADARAAAALARDPAEAAWAAHGVRAAATAALPAAQRIAWRLGDALGVDRDRGIKQKGAQLDVLQGLQMPGVLVEVGFLDHPEEGPYLLSEEGREAVSGALAKAIEDLRARELRARTDPSITARPARDPRAATASPPR
jgi:N-acetylmuramoyl-L-alanine amidase